MQNVMNEIVHIQARGSQDAVIQAFIRWKMITKQKKTDLRMLILAKTFKFTLFRLTQAVKSRIYRVKRTAFSTIFTASLVKMQEINWAKAKSEEEKKIKRKAVEINGNLVNLQQKKVEMEQFIEEMLGREKGYKDEIRHLTEEKKADSARVASLQTQPRRSSRSRARDLAERVQDLEEENRDLREKLDSMEGNVTGFLKEMSTLLDHSSYQGGQGEEGHGSEEEARKPKRGR